MDMDMGMDIDRELELEGQLFGTEHSDPSALQPPQEEEQPRKKQKLCTDEADPLEMQLTKFPVFLSCLDP